MEYKEKRKRRYLCVFKRKGTFEVKNGVDYINILQFQIKSSVIFQNHLVYEDAYGVSRSTHAVICEKLQVIICESFHRC